MTEDDIAEIMSSHAEVVTGHTLGVNFRKYTPKFEVERLQNSAVYRMIHGLD